MNSGALDLSNSIIDYIGGLVQNVSVALSPKPGRVVTLAPGATAAFDDCCAGQVWGRLVNLMPAPGATPGRTPGLSPAAAPWWLATIEIGIVRCAAVLDDQGRAPTPAAITADGEQGIADLAAILSVLRCEPIRSFEGWLPVGPEGGCFGGTLTITVQVQNCLDCG